MKRLGQLLAALVALIGLGALGYAIFKGIEEEPSIVGSLATALAAVLAVVYGQQRQASIEQETANRRKLEPLYAELIDRYRGSYDDEDDDEGAEFFRQFMTPLLMNGSDGVIKSWVDFQRISAKVGSGEDGWADIHQMLAWEGVVAAIRRDLGHAGSDLKPGDLLRVYIHDIDEHLPAVERPRL